MLQWKKMMVVVAFFMAFAGLVSAEVDIPWQWIHQEAIGKAHKQIQATLAPFSAESGFPEKRPAYLVGKNWETTYKAAAQASDQCHKIMVTLIEKNKLPFKDRLGAKYFQYRLAIGANLFPQFAGNEKAYEIFCREFAKACEAGLMELNCWKSAEPIMPFDHLWAPPIREGLPRVKNLLPTIPENIAADQAQNVWRTAAKAAIAASNEAGMTAARVGYFDFPSWRLKFAVKYFKAAIKEAVVGYWDSPRNANENWVKACDQLRTRLQALPAEMDELLNLFPAK